MNKNAAQTWGLDDHYLKVIESDWYKLIVLLENEISFATFDFYRKKNIQTIFLPITTGSISSPMGLGRDSKPVQIELFGIKTYLADSMQFMLEYGCRLHNNGCFYIMPSFRGENADKRHLCQFYHSEVEISGTLEDIIKLAEDYIKFLAAQIVGRYREELLRIVGTVEHIEQVIQRKEFPRVDYTEAISYLETINGCVREDDNGFKYITAMGEKKLIERYNGIVWLTHMDKMIVPFYQATDEKNSKLAKCADLLFGIGEVLGSGERHSTGEEVKESLNFHRVAINEYDWYIKMKEEYPLKTAGFGMGIERFLLWVLKHDDIRDCSVLFRQNGKNIIP